MLYKSGLGFYCINHVQGCSHGCLYPCYAYMMAHSYGRAKTYADWCRPALVANAVEVLTKEPGRKRQKPEIVNLCLTTDPFMTGYPEVTDMSLKLIALLNSRGIRCSVLTKGALPSDLADRERFPADNLLGISLVSLSMNYNSATGNWPGRKEFYGDCAASVRRFCAERNIGCDLGKGLDSGSRLP